MQLGIRVQLKELYQPHAESGEPEIGEVIGNTGPGLIRVNFKQGVLLVREDNTIIVSYPMAPERKVQPEEKKELDKSDATV